MDQTIYAHLQRAKADLWRTIAGWMWVAYTVGIVVAVVSMTA